MSNEDTEDRIVKISARIMEIKAQKEELEEAEKNLRKTLAELVVDGDNYVGDFKINRRNNLRFDAALAEANLTKQEFNKIAVKKADSKKAAALLSPDRLALCKKNFGTQVTVGLRKD